MKKKTKTAQISILVSTLLLTAFPGRADDPVTSVPAAADFWVRDQPGRITHACVGKEPVVLCMQGRKVVMQVQSDRTNGFSYTARFFNLQKEVEKKQALFEAGRESTPELRVNDQPWKSEFPSSVTFDGMLTLTYPEAGGVVVTRTVYPSMTKALVIEEWQVRNATDKPVVVTVPPARTVNPVGEDIAIVWSCPEVKAAEVKAGGVLSFSTSVQAGLAAEPDPAVNLAAERGARLALAEAAWRGPGRLETPEPMLDHAFALQKLHVLESPIETIKGVITHNGSLTYSPGIWANDPVEYSSPLFPFFGDPALNEASMNMYRIWLDHCREHGIDPFPGSFEHAALKLTQRWRGDDAMVLYGLSKFLLFQGDRAAAEEMWPLIEMCAASVLKHTTGDGIVASKTDEMEGRYPTGDANLSTSSLAYGGYRLAARLAQSLGKTDVANMYDTRAAALRTAIESYFGGEVEGFKTYRYYTGNTTLRGWILLPLAMGITERQNATLDAMVSDKLWPNRMQGADILAESTRPTEWGRETYYALRVLFKAGRTEEGLDLTRRVVQAQIFGAKGPYPDEDAIDMLCPGSLYPRVFTEGMFGIVPTGLDSFECTPWLPKAWPRMALRDLRAFGQSWDLVVERVGDLQKVTVLSGGKTLMTGLGPPGKTYALTFPVAVSAKPVSGTSPIAEPYRTLPADGEGFAWESSVPSDCPFPRSPSLTGLFFTGRHSDYRCGDTFYPSWASDGNLYSPWTDGKTDGVVSQSGKGANAQTGHAVMIGDDPLKLEIRNTSAPKVASALPYHGRYPAGSLVYNDIWYYGTYCLGPEGSTPHNGFTWNWPNLGPMPGFQISRDFGKTWEPSPHTPEKPLFPEPEKFLGPVKMGAPHFVDFGKNMEHSPDGKAYLIGMGAEENDPKPRPCIKPGKPGETYQVIEGCTDDFAHANLSWITADQAYLARVTPSPETINDLKAYEFFAGHDSSGQPVWTRDFKKIKPLVEWNNHMGCVTVTYVPGLKKYLMCVTDGWPTVAKMTSYILEADKITGPWRMVSYMKDFGEQAYFLNFPSKFISPDGRSLWLCYSANFSPGWNGVELKFNPPGGRYGLCLHEVELLKPAAPSPDRP